MQAHEAGLSVTEVARRLSIAAALPRAPVRNQWALGSERLVKTAATSSTSSITGAAALGGGPRAALLPC